MAEGLMECRVNRGLELAEEERTTAVRGIWVRFRVRGGESDGCERG